MSFSKRILYGIGGNDECLTLEYAVRPILEFVSSSAVVWCPFDKEENSNFVKLLKENGNKVICSHKDTGQDFFKWEPNEKWDCIISNPPFTGKRLIFQRALFFNAALARNPTGL